MRHDINQIASNFHLNRKRFRDFAQANHNKYGVVIEGSYMTTSTWYTNDLVADFKAVDHKDRFLEPEDLEGMSVLGWKAELEDMSGSLGWHKKGSKLIIYGTPSWNEDGEVPFELSYDDGTYTRRKVLKLSKDNSVDEQRSSYLAVLKTVIESL